MFQIHSLRIATAAVFGVLLLPLGNAWAEQALKTDAAAALEVRVLDAQVQPGSGDRDEVIYRMEVISVLRAATRVEPGDTIVVRSYALSNEAPAEGVEGSSAPRLLSSGWMGVAYLNLDSKASGPETPSRFTIAANGDSFEDIPQGPPSATWTEWIEVAPNQSPSH